MNTLISSLGLCGKHLLSEFVVNITDGHSYYMKHITQNILLEMLTSWDCRERQSSSDMSYHAGLCYETKLFLERHNMHIHALH